jgi:hypothetical protein
MDADSLSFAQSWILRYLMPSSLDALEPSKTICFEGSLASFAAPSFPLGTPSMGIVLRKSVKSSRGDEADLEISGGSYLLGEKRARSRRSERTLSAEGSSADAESVAVRLLDCQRLEVGIGDLSNIDPVA